MKQIKGFLGYLYQHNLVRYLFVGGTTFIIDLGLLVLLHGVLNINITVATSISYWASIAYNFTLNRWWTFSASENKKLHKHLLAYGLLLGCNYLFTVLFVSIVSRHINYAIAKTLAVTLQVFWTYPIYKSVVFANKKSTDPPSVDADE